MPTIQRHEPRGKAPSNLGVDEGGAEAVDAEADEEREHEAEEEGDEVAAEEGLAPQQLSLVQPASQLPDL